MAVSTIYQTKPSAPNKVSTFLVYGLLLLGIGAAIYFGADFIRNLAALRGKSSLIVETMHGEGEVYVNGELVGKTPLNSSEIKPGDNRLVLKDPNSEYEVNINFVPSTEVVVKRDLGISNLFSGGLNFWLERNDSDIVLSIISEPAGADVYVDGTKVGTTPYSSSELSTGEYDLRIEKAGHETQTARIEINNGHKLNVSTNLFAKPVPEKVELLPDSTNIYDVHSDNINITSNTSTWVKAIIYWNQTRGVNLSGLGVNKDRVFDFYLDYAGNLYDADGKPVDTANAAILENAKTGAYLRNSTDSAGFSEKARETYLGLGAVGGKQATILETGVGWLRVRSEPSLNGTEVARVNVGDTLSVLEESPGWVKIKVDDTTEGWVSDTYVSIE